MSALLWKTIAALKRPGKESPGLRHQEAGGGILDQGFLQRSQVLWPVNVRAEFEHRAGESVREQAAESIAKGKLRSKANAIKKTAASPAQANQVKAAVGTRPEHRIRTVQFFQRQSQHGSSKRGGICADDDHPRMPVKEFRERVLQAPAKVAAVLPPALKDSRDHFVWKAPACDKQITCSCTL
jgi:hypothetical protein